MLALDQVETTLKFFIGQIQSRSQGKTISFDSNYNP